MQTQFFVAVDGNDNHDGMTAQTAFATLQRAQKAVRALQDRDAVVHVKEGLYFQKEALQFDERDGANGGGAVAYRAESEKTVISGGVQISGWKHWKGNVWQIDVPDSFPTEQYISNIYLNDKVAVMGRRELVEAERVDRESGVVVFAKDSGFPMETGASDMILQYTYAWMGMMFRIENIVQEEDKFIVKFLNDGGVAEAGLSEEVKEPEIWCFNLINAYEFMTAPGTFYYDRRQRIIYYHAESGEDPNQYTTVIPYLETLIEVRGSDSLHKVENLTFDGFTFSHTMSQRAYRYGIATCQAWMDLSYVDEKAYNYPHLNTGTMIKAFHAEGLKFINNNFCRSNSNGLGIFDGIYHAEITGNTFFDLGSSAMVVGSGGSTPKDYEAETGLTNVSIGASVKVSDPASIARRSDPLRAIDLSYNYGYTLPGGEWMQLDLGEAYTLCQAVIVSGGEQIEIYGSNDEDYSHAELLSRSKEFPPVLADYTGYPGRIDMYEARHLITNKTRFRYIRVVNRAELPIDIMNLCILSPDLGGAKRWDLVYDCDISNNYIARCCTEHYMQCTATIIFTDTLRFTHNEFTQTPYTAINLGTNHHLISYSVAKNNLIAYNKVTGASQRNQDGGPFYSSGPQRGTRIIGNYFKGQVYGMAGIYPDQGSSYYEIARNVVEAVPKGLFPWALDSHDLDIHDNYSSTPVYEFNVPSNVIYNTEVFIRNNMPKHIKAIADEAGLTAEYRHIRERVPVKNRPAYLHEQEIFDWRDYSVLYYAGHCWDFLKCYCEEAEFIIETMEQQGNVALKEFKAIAVEARTFYDHWVDGVVLKEGGDLKEYYRLVGELNHAIESFTKSGAIDADGYPCKMIAQGEIRQCVIDEYYGGSVEYGRKKD